MNHRAPHVTMTKQTWSTELYEAMQGNKGPYGTIWNHTGPYGTIWNHTGSYSK